LVFWSIGFIPRALLPKLVGLFLLGGLQGAVGWYMVKSGLVDRVDVSQYRLMVHFGIAILNLAYTLWLFFELGEGPAARGARQPRALSVALLILGLIYLQMLAGALVAGLDAGQSYNTWPLMGESFIPSGLDELSPWYLNLFENRLTAQFDHRLLGYLVLATTLLQAVWLAWTGRSSTLALSAAALACLVLMQVSLGVWTLLLAVPIGLGIAHQAGAVAVFIAALHHFWLASRAPGPARTQAAASA
jgi:cytochrome c oxidase assembly protein subunit 15